MKSSGIGIITNAANLQINLEGQMTMNKIMRKTITISMIMLCFLLNSCRTADNWAKMGYSLTSISTGDYTIALDTGGNLWACGANLNGQFGGSVNRVLPMQIVATDVKLACTGAGCTMIIKNDSSLWICGNNEDDQIGDGMKKNVTEFKKIMEDVISASAGGGTLFAIKSDNSLWACGCNDYGQMGDGTRENKTTFTKIMEDVLAVSGYQHTMVLKKDNTLWICGNNEDGQIGDGTRENKTEFVKIMENVESISAGVDYSMAVKKDGSLWGWGFSSAGEVIDFDDVKWENAYLTEPIKIMDNILSVSAGFSHVLVIKKDNSLWSWGENFHGSCGVGITDDIVIKSTKIMDDVVMSSVGYSESMAVTRNGDLWAWGNNEFGQLGGGTKEDKNVPTKIISR